jgi:hypothetical protein
VSGDFVDLATLGNRNFQLSVVLLFLFPFLFVGVMHSMLYQTFLPSLLVKQIVFHVFKNRHVIASWGKCNNYFFPKDYWKINTREPININL